jgi:hypothetical protein
MAEKSRRMLQPPYPILLRTDHPRSVCAQQATTQQIHPPNDFCEPDTATAVCAHSFPEVTKLTPSASLKQSGGDGMHLFFDLK